MKALSLIAIFFAAFMIFLGVSTRSKEGILSDAVIVGGSLIAGLVVIIWIVKFIKERSEN